MAHAWRLPMSVLAAAALVACQGSPTARRPSAGRATTAAATGGQVAALSPRILTGDRLLQLGGEVRLISDHGGGIISNNSGALISDQGGGLISDQGGGIVSNNSGAIVSNNAGGLRVLAQADAGATPSQESRLADALIELVDASGRPLAGPDGKPIQATTDRQGRYRLQAMLPPGEGAVARVKLFNGGELRALVLAEAGATASARNLDTAATLGTSYVLDELVKGKAELLAKVPLAEAVALDREAEAARVRLGGTKPSYSAADTLALARRLKGEDKAFGDRLDRIAAILAAGQANRGQGLPATRVPLSAPMGVVPQPDGGAILFEHFYGQPRRLRPDGTMEELSYPAGAQRPLIVSCVAPTRDGGALLLEAYTGRLLKVSADLQSLTAVGPGLPANAAAPTWLEASAVAEGPNGEILIATDDIKTYAPGELFILPPGGGAPESIKMPMSIPGLGSMAGGSGLGAVAMDREGSIYVGAYSVGKLESGETKGYWWMAKRLKSGSWEPLFGPMPAAGGSKFVKGAIYPDRPGGPLAMLDGPRVILAPGPDGRWAPINNPSAGPNEGGLPMAQSGFLEPIAGAALPGGGFLIVDKGTGLLQEWTPEGRVVDRAGSRAMEAVGQAQVVGLNTPAQPLELPDGSLLVPEGANGVIKRLQGGKLSLFAGGRGATGLPAPKEQVAFNLPTAMARDPKTGALYLTTSDGLMRIDPDGLVHMVMRASGGEFSKATDADGKLASEASIGVPQGVVLDDAGRPWVVSRTHDCVYMLDSDGVVRRMAGAGEESKLLPNPLDPDGPATGTVMVSPFCLTQGPDGRIYIADTLRFRVRALDPKTGQMVAVAGCNLIEASQRSNQELDPDGGPALEARLLGPIALAFDREGNLFIAEAGTGVAARGSGLVPNLGFEVPDIAPQIRKLTPDGRLFRVAGPSAPVLNGSGGYDDVMGMPTGLLVDGQGRLAISDSVRNQLKLLPPEALRGAL